MILGFCKQPARWTRTLSLAVALACGIAIALPDPALAENETSAYMLSKKKGRSAAGGVASPVKRNWSVQSGGGGKATTVTEVVSDGAGSPFLLPGSGASFEAVAGKYAAIVASGGWPRVPGGKLKKGAEGKGVSVLNQRLHSEGYLRSEAVTGQFAAIFTSATEDALRRFQRNHGLAVTGSIDGSTLSQLNVPAERRLATIRANIPRIAEYAKNLGSRYVVVNIPAAQIETVSDGRVYSRHNAIVGRPSRPTPVVMTPLATVRFNPYWNAPPSIVEKDILPRMISSGPRKVMADMNMKIFDGVGGPEVEPNSVNWRRAVVDDYHFRQEPGGSNAMATAKIEFDSPFGIYLHDTPEPHLFGTAQRFYSSGCVRVQNVPVFINWILQGQDGINAARISELADTKERLDTPIAAPPQLRVAYLTAWPARDGVAAFRNDVYELDGTGFVLGQPLPVGEGGQRYVLKPVPRSQQAVDADEAFGFASLFRSRNPDKQSSAARRGAAKSGDALARTGSLTVKPKPAKTVAREKTKTRTAAIFGRRLGNPGKETGVLVRPVGKGVASKSLFSSLNSRKKLTASKAKTVVKTVTAKKVVNQDKAEAAAKKPDAKAVAAKKKILAAATAKTTVAETKVKTAVAAKKPVAEQCKPAREGKLTAGCKAPAVAKKPVAKPEKSAAATN